MPPKRGDRDWEDSFYSMEEKYRQLQKQLQEKDTALKLEKVRNVKESLRSSVGQSKSLVNITGISRNQSNISNNASSTTARPLSAAKRPGLSSPQTPRRVASAVVVSPHTPMNGSSNPSVDSQRRFSTQSTSAIPVVTPPLEKKADSPSVIQQLHNGAPHVTDLDELLQRVTAPLDDVPNVMYEVATVRDYHAQSMGGLCGAPASAGTGAFNQSGCGDTFFDHSTAHFGASTARPDPQVDPLLMLWGHNSVTAQNNALYQMNSTMKSALEEAQSLLKTCQHDLASQRALSNRLQQQLDEGRIELSQTVRERDLSTQKLTNATNTISQQQSLLQVATDEKEKLRFNLESQLRDLRSRLASAAENNDALSSDTRTLITELRESGSRVAALQSKFVLMESSYTHQVNLNQTMVGELESLNKQLGNERKKMLSMARDMQSYRGFAEERHSLEGRVSQLTQDKLVLEKEHLRLLDDMLSLTQSTAAQARGEVRSQLEDLTSAAHHWERVSALLYQDVSQRNAVHAACRDECDEAKRQRDEALAAAKSLRQELAIASAKLDIIWPNHIKDTQLFDDVEAMKATFGRIMGGGGGGRGERMSDALARFTERGVDGRVTSHVDFSFLTSVAPEELVRELQAANAAIYAELESLKAANDVLTEQLRMAQETHKAAVMAAKEEADNFKRWETENHYALADQCDRIDFLENQVALLRGVVVQPSTSVESLGANETIAEVFVGQVLSAHGLVGDVRQLGIGETNGDDPFPSLFCTVDFLVHETATTGVVTGYQSFFDLTMAYRFTMDTLFLYYLQTRGMRVQLYRMKGSRADDEAISSYELLGEGVINLVDLVANERILCSQRPQLRGHIKLHRPESGETSLSGSSQNHNPAKHAIHVASVEYSITIRTPFSPSFIQHVRKQLETSPSSLGRGLVGNHRRLLAPSLRFGGTDARSSYALLERIEKLCIEFVSMSIPYTVEPVPQLSLYYTIPQVGVEGHVPPAFQIPRYETRYSESDRLGNCVENGLRDHSAVSLTSMCKRISPRDSFSVEEVTPPHVVTIHTRQLPKDASVVGERPLSYTLSKVLGEPIPVVAFDEFSAQLQSTIIGNTSVSNSGASSSGGNAKYWALGLIHWGTVLEAAARTVDAGRDHGVDYSEVLSVAMLTAEGEHVGTLAVRVTLGGWDRSDLHVSTAQAQFRPPSPPSASPSAPPVVESRNPHVSEDVPVTLAILPEPMGQVPTSSVRTATQDRTVGSSTASSLGSERPRASARQEDGEQSVSALEAIDRYRPKSTVFPGSQSESRAPTPEQKDHRTSLKRPIQQSIYSANTSMALPSADATPNLSHIGAGHERSGIRPPNRIGGLVGVLLEGAGGNSMPAPPIKGVHRQGSIRDRATDVSIPSTIGSVHNGSVL